MNEIFDNKKPDYKKLIKYGFSKKGQIYSYKKEIYNDQFELEIEVENKDVSTKLIDLSTEELYTLHLLDGAEGTFIGQIREEYEQVLNDISEKCFVTDVFEFKQSLQVLDYTMEKYGTAPEYLWEKFPRNAVCRRKDNKKWYLAILSVKGFKIGLESDDIVELIDVRVNKDEIEELLNTKNNLPIYPAYHMNKKSWITIILNNQMNIDKIFEFIDKSYELAKK